MNVLILAGGYGTRLYPLIKDTAKALLDINGKPLIDFALRKVKGLSDLKEVIVVTNDKFYNDFQNWKESKQEYACPIRVINDCTKTPEDRLGSIGDIQYVIDQEDIEDDLMVIGGDNLFDQPIEGFVEFARSKQPRVTVGVYDLIDKEKCKNFGVVALDHEKKIVSFEEKPKQPKSSFIGMCLYYFPKNSLNLIGKYLKESKKADAAGGYINWLYQHEHVFGYVFTGKWYDIGSIESYKEAQNYFES